MSRSNAVLKKTIWEQTPSFVQWVEIVLGIMAWAILGAYIGLAEGYDPVTLVLFFISQMAYIGMAPFVLNTLNQCSLIVGTMLRIAKKKENDQDDKYTSSKLEVGAALVTSVFFMFVHLFFTGTYAVLAVRTIVNVIQCSVLIKGHRLWCFRTR